MAYNKVQFISYQVNTFPKLNYLDAFRSSYLGADKAKTDINYRCNLMKTAIDNASKSKEISTDSNHLKVFMAPEFYFRNTDGAYPIEEVSTVMEVMRKHVKDSKFKDWIFVFGTAIGFLELEDKSKEVFNVAMVQKGGTDKINSQTSVIVYKEFVSHIDFIREKLGKLCPGCNRFIPNDWDSENGRSVLIGKSTGDVVNDMSKIRPTEGSRDLLSKRVEDSGKGKEKTITGLGGQGIFTMSGVTFGLEICLDHLNGRLKDSPPKKGDNLVQVQLIPSAGASIVQNNVVCINGGLIFNVDGNGATQVDRNKGDHNNPKVLYGSHPNAIKINDNIPLDFSVIAKNWNGFFNEQGTILVYEPQGLPKSAVM